MAYTTNYNLPEMPTGAVEWPALFNDVVTKLERGRTLRLTAGEALAQYDPFYLKSDGKAWKADDTTDIRGIWISSSTAQDTDGFGQIDGTITNESWAWTIGDAIYVDDSSALTQTPGAISIGYALSDTVMVIHPMSSASADANSDLASLSGAVGIGFEETQKPAAGGIYSPGHIPYDLDVPANASTSYSHIAANPTAEAVVSIKDDGSEIATLTIATNGTMTFATSSGTSKTIAKGSLVTFTFPASQDATLAGVVITLVGTRSIS